jgi:hypothetical protein
MSSWLHCWCKHASHAGSRLLPTKRINELVTTPPVCLRFCSKTPASRGPCSRAYKRGRQRCCPTPVVEDEHAILLSPWPKSAAARSPTITRSRARRRRESGCAVKGLIRAANEYACMSRLGESSAHLDARHGVVRLEKPLNPSQFLIGGTPSPGSYCVLGTTRACESNC